MDVQATYASVDGRCATFVTFHLPPSAPPLKNQEESAAAVAAAHPKWAMFGPSRGRWVTSHHVILSPQTGARSSLDNFGGDVNAKEDAPLLLSDRQRAGNLRQALLDDVNVRGVIIPLVNAACVPLQKQTPEEFSAWLLAMVVHDRTLIYITPTFMEALKCNLVYSSSSGSDPLGVLDGCAYLRRILGTNTPAEILHFSQPTFADLLKLHPPPPRASPLPRCLTFYHDASMVGDFTLVSGAFRAVRTSTTRHRKSIAFENQEHESAAGSFLLVTTSPVLAFTIRTSDFDDGVVATPMHDDAFTFEGAEVPRVALQDVARASAITTMGALLKTLRFASDINEGDGGGGSLPSYLLPACVQPQRHLLPPLPPPPPLFHNAKGQKGTHICRNDSVYLKP